ncbi:hypothetical protein EJ08DRAFT_726244 [Tothia fuscella]|uniref:Uncharacterized protein n=1 Tax=Tothia fuscella TaxID=1048955 RepID=A0A9P4TTZ4_9PEZI|nr:hypothetical protein EJ08DRAFT_726244 [Tothia fuscella]
MSFPHPEFNIPSPRSTASGSFAPTLLRPTRLGLKRNHVWTQLAAMPPEFYHKKSWEGYPRIYHNNGYRHYDPLPELPRDRTLLEWPIRPNGIPWIARATKEQNHDTGGSAGPFRAIVDAETGKFYGVIYHISRTPGTPFRYIKFERRNKASRQKGSRVYQAAKAVWTIPNDGGRVRSRRNRISRVFRRRSRRQQNPMSKRSPLDLRVPHPIMVASPPTSTDFSSSCPSVYHSFVDEIADPFDSHTFPPNVFDHDEGRSGFSDSDVGEPVLQMALQWKVLEGRAKKAEARVEELEEIMETMAGVTQNLTTKLRNDRMFPTGRTETTSLRKIWRRIRFWKKK